MPPTTSSRALDHLTLIEVQPTRTIAAARFVSNQTFLTLTSVPHQEFGRYDRDEETLYINVEQVTNEKLEHFQKMGSDAQIVHWHLIREVITAARQDGIDILAVRGQTNFLMRTKSS